jgi:branched-subunit amino acid aminotransferase/4-amino-4-deoxychorismate lyase
MHIPDSEYSQVDSRQAKAYRTLVSEIEERMITVAELRRADEVFLIDSVRKWMRVLVSDML